MGQATGVSLTPKRPEEIHRDIYTLLYKRKSTNLIFISTPTIQYQLSDINDSKKLPYALCKSLSIKVYPIGRMFYLSPCIAGDLFPVRDAKCLKDLGCWFPSYTIFELYISIRQWEDFSTEAIPVNDKDWLFYKEECQSRGIFWLVVGVQNIR